MNKANKISASLLCADLVNIEKYICALEKLDIDYLHMDFMDGHFVDNFGFPPNILNDIRKVTAIPFDIHLMVAEPTRLLSLFHVQKNDIISIHVESTIHVHKALQNIKNLGVLAGLAINPGTPLCALDYLWDVVDVIVIMTVNPGFAGAKLVPCTIEKINHLKKIIESRNYDVQIEVDGNVSIANAKLMAQAGADIFVAGTSSIFKADLDIFTGTKELREALA